MTLTDGTFPCWAGGADHPAHRDYCPTCEPAAPAGTPDECRNPERGQSDWACRRCGGVLCAGGHTHRAHSGQTCLRC